MNKAGASWAHRQGKQLHITYAHTDLGIDMLTWESRSNLKIIGCVSRYLVC